MKIQNTLKMLVVAAALTLTLFAMSACEKKGPMESAGKKADDAVKQAGDKVEEAGDKVQDAAKDATNP